MRNNGKCSGNSWKKEKDQLKTLPETLRRNQKVSGVDLNGLSPRTMPLEEVHEIVPPVPKKCPEVDEPNLKVMDHAMSGKKVQVPLEERIPKVSPELPFVDRRFPEPEIREVEEEVAPVSIREQRPSSFEEQLRINGELVSSARNQSENLEAEPDQTEEFTEEQEDFYRPLSQPVFLQKADETEESNPEEIFRERWGGSDETGPGLDLGMIPPMKKKSRPFMKQMLLRQRMRTLAGIQIRKMNRSLSVIPEICRRSAVMKWMRRRFLVRKQLLFRRSPET